MFLFLRLHATFTSFFLLADNTQPQLPLPCAPHRTAHPLSTRPAEKKLDQARQPSQPGNTSAESRRTARASHQETSPTALPNSARRKIRLDDTPAFCSFRHSAPSLLLLGCGRKKRSPFADSPNTWRRLLLQKVGPPPERKDLAIFPRGITSTKGQHGTAQRDQVQPSEWAQFGCRWAEEQFLGHQ